MAYSHDKILYGNKEKWSTDIHDDIDKPYKCYDKWKKPITKC